MEKECALRLRFEAARALICTGIDALRFLNGQVTQDVRAIIGTRRVLPSCLTDAKGRLQHRVWLGAGPLPVASQAADDQTDTKRNDEAIWLIELEANPSASLLERLERYLVADEVIITACEGYFWIAMAQEGHLPEVQDHEAQLQWQLVWWGRPAVLCYDLVLPEGPWLETEAAESLRIEAAAPAWGCELKAGMHLAEAGLDRTDVSFAKGCYVGQEVISRIESAQKTNQRLYAVKFAPGQMATGPWMCEGREVGFITSLRADGCGLAYIKRGYEAELSSWLRQGVEIRP